MEVLKTTDIEKRRFGKHMEFVLVVGSLRKYLTRGMLANLKTQVEKHTSNDSWCWW